MYAEAFRDADTFTTTTSDATEGVPLAEKAAVLELLFQFMRLQQPPQLDALPIQLLLDLAEAAEKYFVHGAIAQCRSQIRLWVIATKSIEKRDLLGLLKYGDRHQFTAMLDDVAPQTLNLAKKDVADVLSDRTFKAWVLYSTTTNGSTSHANLAASSTP